MGCHHKLEEYLDAHIAAAGVADDRKNRLFRAASDAQASSDRPMSRVDAWYMVRRRAADAGIENVAIRNDSFRAIGITDYMENGGDITIAQRMAGHANIKTPQFYERRADEVSFSEIERVGI